MESNHSQIRIFINTIILSILLISCNNKETITEPIILKANTIKTIEKKPLVSLIEKRNSIDLNLTAGDLYNIDSINGFRNLKFNMLLDDFSIGSPLYAINNPKYSYFEYSLDTDLNGRLKVTKLGTKEVTKEGFEFELTLNFEIINEQHLAKASKDRTGLYMNKPEFVISSATGRRLVNWASMTSEMDLNKLLKNCKKQPFPFFNSFIYQNSRSNYIP